MLRRSFVAIPAAIALAACGFELRRAPEFAFKTIAVPSQGAIAIELRRTLASAGTLQVLPTTAKPDEAQVILDVLSENREKVIVGINASGQVREFQLRTRLHFRLRTPKGRELIPDTELLQTRDVSFNESAVLAKEAEEGLLYRDMQTDLVQQLMRRIAAVKQI
ncbi:LPS assembly lipoprotein LptE [Ramlibacter sp. MMS24-I3-19]|uniref:LPS-assembly lipoprotein LptE n=1 Tax=Ramlibacter sp. MMS24-I3-19 TaxID=3416606 RepID=UPI003CFF8205